MGTNIYDANGQIRVGNRLVGMVDWHVVSTLAGTVRPGTGDLIAVGALTGDLTVILPEAPESGAQIGVYLVGDPSPHNVTFDTSGNTIAGGSGPVMDTRYQFIVLAFDGVTSWGISSFVEQAGGIPTFEQVLAAGSDAGTQSATFSPAVLGDAVILANGGAITGLGDVALVGLTGAVTPSRFVGGTASVAPTTGTFAVNDFVVTSTGRIFVCTVAGTPGTWVEPASVTFAPKASPTFTGTVTIPQGAAVLSAASVNQLTSALTITSGALPALGAWSSGIAQQNPVTRQIVVAVEVVTDGTANAATCAVAISPDNSTFTTIGTPGASAALNTVGGETLLSSVTVPAGWWIKLTFSHCTVAASKYY